MKCKQCGNDFEGKFCPECGAKTVEDSSMYSQGQQQNYQQPTQTVTAEPDKKKKKKKKPIYKRVWFILLVIFVIFIGAISLSGNGEKIVWNEMVLGEVLPQPPAKRGEVKENSSEELRVDFNKVSDKQYEDYISECKEKGFTVDAEKQSSDFKAYNSDGYKLNVSHYSEKMSVDLNEPMKLSAIKWPTGTAGKVLPVPKSLKGSFQYEHDDNFCVYIGDTSKQAYDEYVNACIKKGFNVDYSKDEKYYSAKNKSGWELSLKYIGGSVMSINIDKPEKSNEETKTTKPTESTSKKNNETSTSLRPEFKKAMDSYENFMSKYVDFMKKYKDNPTDIGILADYSKYMKDYADMCDDFDKWNDEDLNNEELAYYVDVQARVSKKLLEVSE